MDVLGTLFLLAASALGFGMVIYAAQSGRVFERIEWVSERDDPLRFWGTTLFYLLFGIFALLMLINEPSSGAA